MILHVYAADDLSCHVHYCHFVVVFGLFHGHFAVTSWPFYGNFMVMFMVILGYAPHVISWSSHGLF